LSYKGRLRTSLEWRPIFVAKKERSRQVAIAQQLTLQTA